MELQRLGWSSQTGWAGDRSFPADLILYFGDAGSIERAAPALAECWPDALAVGCSTAGAISDREILETGVAAVACRFASTRVRLVEADVPDASHSADAGGRLGEALRGEGLAGVFMLSDGLDVNGSALASGAARALGVGVPLSGGLAADGAAFLRTVVGAGRSVRGKRIAALGFYGAGFRSIQASASGWTPFGPRRVITASSGCTLRELDHKPALQLYERYLGDEAAGLPGTALLFPLMIWDPTTPAEVQTRTVLSIDRAHGTMTFAGEIPVGWRAQLMHGTFDTLVESAAIAGQAVHDRLDRHDGDALALLVSCVGRRLLLRQRAEEELHATHGAIGGGTACLGFYSHGEIAQASACGAVNLQNQTLVITTIAEAG